MRKSGLVVIIVLAILIIGGALALNHKSTNNTPQPTSSSTASNSSQPSTTGSVDIRNMMFTPSQITVAKGGTVTWTNNDSIAHTVVDDLSNVGGPSSGDIQPGSTYSFTFNKTGSFQYHCSIHPSMRGTIVVK
jgi:plastocyanin